MTYSPRLKQAIWALLEFLSSPVTQIIQTPFLLKLLGTKEFGLWLFAMSVIGFGAMGSFGIAQASTKHVSAERCSTSVARVVQSSIVLVLIIAITVTPLVALTVSNVGGDALEKLGPSKYIASIIVISVLAMFTQEIDYVLSAVLRGKGEFQLAAKLEICLRPVIALLLITSASIFPEAITLIILYLALLIIKILIKVPVLKSKINQEKLFGCRFGELKFRPLLQFGIWTWAQTLGGLSLSVVDRLLVGFIFGSQDLARYGICTQVAQFVHAIPAAALQVIFPWLNRSIVEKNRPGKAQLSKLAIFTILGTLPLSIFVYISIPEILTIWIGAEFAEANSEMARVIVLIYGLLALGAGTHFILLGLGDARYIGLVNLIAGVLTVTISVAVSTLGLLAFAFAKLVYPLVTFAYFFRLRRVR